MGIGSEGSAREDRGVLVAGGTDNFSIDDDDGLLTGINSRHEKEELHK
jgi:hypothetical protein